MSHLQSAMADQVIDDLKHGADTLVDISKVPSAIIGNKHMRFEAAVNCADQLATPPMDGFRSNPFYPWSCGALNTASSWVFLRQKGKVSTTGQST